MRFRLASFARWLGPSFDLSSPSRYTRRRPSGRLRCLGPKAIRVYQPSVRDERPRRVTFRTYKGETSPGSVAIRGEEKSGSPLWRQGHNPCAAAPRDRALRFGLGDRRSRSGPPDGPAMDEGLAVRPTPSIASRSRLPRSSPQRRRSSSRNDKVFRGWIFAVTCLERGPSPGTEREGVRLRHSGVIGRGDRPGTACTSEPRRSHGRGPKTHP